MFAVTFNVLKKSVNEEVGSDVAAFDVPVPVAALATAASLAFVAVTLLTSAVSAVSFSSKRF
jgi:hypothetical protein